MLLNDLISHLKRGSLGSHLMQKALANFFLQALFAALSFANGVILARLLGTGGYGAYSNAVAWISVLAMISSFGFDILLVRNIASYKALRKFDELKGLLYFSGRYVFLFSILVTLAFGTVAKVWLFSQAEDVIQLAMWWGMTLIPFLALMSVNASILRGLEHVIHARLPGVLIRPGLIMLGTLAIFFFYPKGVGVAPVMAVNLGATLFALALGVFWQRGFLPAELAGGSHKYEIRAWMRSAVVLLVFGGVQTFYGQIGTIMLGILGTAAEVGLFSVASRVAYLLVFALVAVEIILAPVIARLGATGERGELQGILTRTVRSAFVFVLLPSLILIFLGDRVLLFFGVEYAAGQKALVYLVLGQLVNIAAGSGAVVLFMLGYESLVAVTFTIVACMSVAANLVVIPVYGLNGAAVVSAASLVMINLILSVFVVRRTGLHATILGRMGRVI